MDRHGERQGSADRQRIVSQGNASQTEAGSETGKSSLGVVRLCMQGQPWETASNPAYREMGMGSQTIMSSAERSGLCKKTQVLQTKPLSIETLQIERGFVSSHRLCKQTDSVNSDSIFREGRTC